MKLIIGISESVWVGNPPPPNISPHLVDIKQFFLLATT